MSRLMKKNHARRGPGIWYRARADLRGRRLQTGSVVLVVALAPVLIGLALAVFGSVQAPFDRLFTQLNGAHLWVYYPSSPTQGQLNAVIHTPNVAASTELEVATGNASILLASQKFNVYIQSFPTQEPAIGQLLITQGHGLATSDPDVSILSQPFANAQNLQSGSALTLVTPHAPSPVHPHPLSVDITHV